MNLYEGMVGIVFDIVIVGAEDLTGIQNPVLHVRRPTGEEIEWPVVVLFEENIFRHVLEEPLIFGFYTIHPYFELDGFRGPWGAVDVWVKKRWYVGEAS